MIVWINLQSVMWRMNMILELGNIINQAPSDHHHLCRLYREPEKSKCHRGSNLIGWSWNLPYRHGLISWLSMIGQSLNAIIGWDSVAWLKFVSTSSQGTAEAIFSQILLPKFCNRLRSILRLHSIQWNSDNTPK
jgi:hypothetical protein